MSHEFHFEPKIDFDCLRDTIATIREGDILANKFELVDHACHLLGGVNALANQMLNPTDPDHPVIGQESPQAAQLNSDEIESVKQMSIKQVAARLEQQAGELQPAEGAESFGAAPVGALNPIFKALLERLIQLLLEQLF